MARAFPSDHEYVDISRRDDLFEVNVEGVKGEGTAGFQVRSDFRCIYVSLFFSSGNEDYRDVSIFDSFSNGLDFEAGCFSFFNRFAAFIQADDDADAGLS